MSVFIFALLCLYIVSADICTQSNACVTTRCPGCSVFTTAFFQTNPQTKKTFLAFNVSNQCTQSAAKPGVIFVAFNLNSPSQGLTLVPDQTSGTYQGANYQWTVSTGAPDGTDALPAPKPTNYLKFTATGAGVVNGHQTKMSLAPGNLNYEIFRFTVTGYDPTYNWVFRFHYADQYEAHGYIDISNCQCDSCDSNHQKRVVTQCTLGYPETANPSSSRASTIFNEDLILYSFAATNNINNVGQNLISLYYSDEYPLMLGIDRIVEGGQTTMAPTPPAFAPVPQAPTCINNPNFGFPVDNPKVKTASVDNSGAGNGCTPNTVPSYTCPRPLPPSLFLTDITDNPAARSGDWQQNGTGYLPNKICGLFYYSRKNINSVAADGTVTADVLGFQSITGLTLPPTNSLGGLLPPWNFGDGADPIPVFAPTNPTTNRFEYGTQVAWDVAKLPLRDARNYRFQIMAHDGDSTKVGGDIGEACVNIIVQCDAGFVNVPGDAKPCSSCDLTPLPGDGKWTWFASPATVPLPGPDSPLANVYILTKIPKSKLTQEPYKTYLADGTGFIPGPGVIDKAGFAITCDAKRIIKPCPLNCCGNGKCDYTKGVCQCFGPPEGLLDANTCCPTNAPTKTPTVAPTSTGAPTVFQQPTAAPTPPTEAPTTAPCFNNGAGCINGVCNIALNVCNCSDPAFLLPDCRAPPCYNNGRYCNGNGACVNETCVCNDPAFLLPDCSAPPPPQPKCTDIISSGNIDCKVCVDDPIAKKLGCVYCPPPGNRTDPLVGGTCVSLNACQKPAASCQPVVVTIPPQCADNCSGNGICVNLTYCRQLEIENKAKYGNNTDQYPLNCGENANKSQSYNQTGACACYPGFTGFNCGLVGSKTLVALAALGAGLIALIVIMALLGAAMCGGGAVAVSQGVTSDASGHIITSPLYESSAGSGTNPLATEAYELF